MSDTPRVDSVMTTCNALRPDRVVVRVEFARDLERELARAMRVIEAAKALANNCEEYEFDDGIGYAAPGMWWHDLDNALEEWEAGR